MDARYAGVPDELWQAVKGKLPRARPKPKGGRPRVDDRQIFSGIVYRLRTGANGGHCRGSSARGRPVTGGSPSGCGVGSSPSSGRPCCCTTI